MRPCERSLVRGQGQVWGSLSHSSQRDPQPCTARGSEVNLPTGWCTDSLQDTGSRRRGCWFVSGECPLSGKMSGKMEYNPPHVPGRWSISDYGGRRHGTTPHLPSLRDPSSHWLLSSPSMKLHSYYLFLNFID